MYRVFNLNGGMIFSGIYWSIKPFLLERQRNRAVFVDSTQQAIKDALTTLIDLDQIPTEYGGTADSLENTKQTFPSHY